MAAWTRSCLALAFVAAVSATTDYGGADYLGRWNEDLHVPPTFDDDSLADTDVIAPFGRDFEIGLATAPAHVEDQLEDAWLAFAEQGHVAAWKNVGQPAERTRFWTQPEVEIDLASATGARVFRMGIDWGRLVPSEAMSSRKEVDEAAWARYATILKRVGRAGMRVMLTLFHHSLPPWLGDQGGWTNATVAVEHFRHFAASVLSRIGADEELAGVMHSVIPFNEPHVFALLTYCAGMWPPGGAQPSAFKSLNCFSPWGGYGVAMGAMADAHVAAHAAARAAGLGALPVGVAHHVPVYDAVSLADKPAQRISEAMTTFWFQDLIHEHCDYIGINYYGRELLSGLGVALLPSEEYSEAGRSVFPDGLYRVLRAFHKRYARADGTAMPLYVTENGIADGSDVLRRAYLVEHLLAVRAAIESGVEVRGYVFWTISDNWEWADGYCPRFGLVEVNRSSAELERTPRPSYRLFTEIASSPGGAAVTAGHRRAAWADVQAAAHAKSRRRRRRPFCRADDGKGSRDAPGTRAFSKRDWRYGKRPADETSRRGERRADRFLNGTLWAPTADALERSWAEAAAKLRERLELGERDAAAALDAVRAQLDAGLRNASEALSGMDAEVRAHVNAAHEAAQVWVAEVTGAIDKRARRDRQLLRQWGERVVGAWRRLTASGPSAAESQTQ